MSISSVLRALSRARRSIQTVASTYLISVGVGMLMAHSGSTLALSARDRIVSQAQSSPTLTALLHGDRWHAALLDFAANLMAAVGTTLAGLGVLMPYPLIAFRGWVGGIVSIDSAHASRLSDPAEALSYVTTLLLQLIPYALSGGAGVNVGLALFRPRPCYQDHAWWGIPKEAVRDALRIYVIVIPLFLLASVWEFLMR